jgi:hypothetical protein
MAAIVRRAIRRELEREESQRRTAREKRESYWTSF